MNYYSQDMESRKIPWFQSPPTSHNLSHLIPPSDGNKHRISTAGGLEASAPETPERKQRKARGAWLGSMGSGKPTEKMGKMKLDPLDPELPQNSSRQPQYHPAFWAKEKVEMVEMRKGWPKAGKTNFVPFPVAPLKHKYLPSFTKFGMRHHYHGGFHAKT